VILGRVVDSILQSTIRDAAPFFIKSVNGQSTLVSRLIRDSSKSD